MITTWNWIKGKLDFGHLYFLLFLGLAAVEGFTESWTSAWVFVDIVLAVFFLLLYGSSWTRSGASGGVIPPPRTFEEGEVQVLLSKGSVEPIETPIDTAQAAHPKDCVVCKRFLEGPL